MAGPAIFEAPARRAPPIGAGPRGGLRDTQLHIDGRWRPGAGGRLIDVVDPATGRTIGHVAHADRADLDKAVAAAARGFHVWRGTSAFERGRVLRRAAELLRERVEAAAAILTSEQGKPLAEARTVATLSGTVETGMLTVNHLGPALPEPPFGGVKDSGYGSEGGPEALEAYLNTKFVTHLPM